ncbi:uronyl 2-sulfotransferase-like, partial [Oppia nitens]|uniref:uronyl 2-sulfotransferase-like n=1 Tax=Oppia nitens TaxID=1686743 RepID=UPI0023DB6575
FDISKLIYNRVPKCGSTTLITLLENLSKLNHFKHYNSKIYNKRLLNFKQQKIFINELMQYSAPFSYDRHIYFINFELYNVSNIPIYINIIREPVERVISSYYYRRFVALKSMTNNLTDKSKPSDYWFNKSFEKCVFNKDSECDINANNSFIMSLLPYFCGQHRKCLDVNSKWALEAAKHNIEKHYKVVGILEYFNVTLKVLQHIIPQFFEGVLNSYYNNDNNKIHKNKNIQKQQISHQIKSYLKANLSNDYELYEFAVQRLFKQYKYILQESNRTLF